MTESRVLPVAVQLKNGMVLVAGGQSGATGGASDSAELYNPATQTFTCVVGGTGFFKCNTSMTDSRQFFTATLLPVSGKVLLAGGMDNAGNRVSTTELFNPVSASFGAGPLMTSPRDEHSATLITGGPGADQILIVGGKNNSGNILVTAELYSEKTNKFSCVGGGSPPCKASLHAPRENHYAVLIGAGAP